ncbi:hypothetical protein [Ruminococcus flavefaciens]
MKNNNTAADREKAVNGKTMQAMNEQYKNCKTERRGPMSIKWTEKS